jgi:hypothetical protein
VKRLLTCLVAALLCAGADAAASGAAPKEVELEINGHPAARAEEAPYVAEWIMPSVNAGCGVRGGVTVGKNPSTAAKLAAIEQLEPTCESENRSTAGTYTLNQVEIAVSGKVTLTLLGKVRTQGGCFYETTKLEGTELFPGVVLEPLLKGTATRESGSPSSCAKKLSTEGSFYAYSPATEELYNAVLLP